MDSYCVGEAPYVKVHPQKVENYKKLSAALSKKKFSRRCALILWYSSQQEKFPITRMLLAIVVHLYENKRTYNNGKKGQTG
jgi:hypothetical protein